MFEGSLDLSEPGRLFGQEKFEFCYEMGTQELPAAGRMLQIFQFFTVSPYFWALKPIQSNNNQVYKTPYTSTDAGKLKFWK